MPEHKSVSSVQTHQHFVFGANGHLQAHVLLNYTCDSGWTWSKLTGCLKRTCTAGIANMDLKLDLTKWTWAAGIDNMGWRHHRDCEARIPGILPEMQLWNRDLWFWNPCSVKGRTESDCIMKWICRAQEEVYVTVYFMCHHIHVCRWPDTPTEWNW